MKFDPRLISEALRVRLWFATTIGLGFVVGILIVGQAWVLASIVDNVFLKHQTFQQVMPMLALLAVMALFRFLFAWGSATAGKKLAVEVKTDLRTRLMKRLLELGPSFTVGERSGELTHTITAGIDALDAWFSQYLPQVVLAFIMPLTILLAVFPNDIISGLVLLFTAPLIPFFMILIGSAAESLTQRQWKTLSRLAAHFLDVLQGLTTLKLFGRSRDQIRTIARISDEYRKTTMSVLRVAFLSALALEMLATLSVAIIAVEIGIRVMRGQIIFLNAFFILILAPDFYQPLRLLGSRFHAGMDGVVAANRIFAILNAKPQNDPYRKRLLSRQSPESLLAHPFRIRFEQVSVQFEKDRQALCEIDFEMSRGQHIALVGPSGAGKSTIAHLLMRFITPTAGSIFIDHTPLETVDPKAWRQQLAWLPQHPILFNMSIAENIRLGAPEASADDVIRAAKLAYAHAFIEELPQGYDTVVGEHGARLSGGQIQRIALARAFLRNAPIVILDEPTAHLDPIAEAEIQTAIAELLRNRTALIIAHRLHTIMHAHRILVIVQGRIVEEGDHMSLLAKRDGVYQQLLRAYSPQ